MKITKQQLKKIIKEEISKILNENVEMNINKNEFRHFSGRDDVFTTDDVRLIQQALGEQYYVIDPDDRSGFIKYVQRQEETPNGGEAVVPLITIEQRGQRINYFKTAQSHIYGKIAT